MKVGILLIATGRYIEFFGPLYKAIHNNFLRNHHKIFFLWTDAIVKPEDIPKDVCIFPIKAKGHPGDTLYRYHYFMQHEVVLKSVDLLYYMDIDSAVIETIEDSEIFPDASHPLVVTEHPGFCDENCQGTPERRPESTAYIPTHCQNPYVCGGYNGGYSKDFLAMASVIKQRIDMDASKNIVAIWHDESHLNHYVYSFPHLFRRLSVSYMYPEGFNGIRGKLFTSPAKILALEKHHIQGLRTPGPQAVSLIDPKRPKIAAIIYHSDVHKIYERRWYVKCLNSILDQTWSQFDILELAYGNEFKESLLQYCEPSKTMFKPLYFWAIPMKNHAFAMNFLLDKAFTDMNYDYVFNVNVDDYYHLERFERELRTIESPSVDLVSSNFAYIQEDETQNDITTNVINVYNVGGRNFAGLSHTILQEDTNLIAHSSVCFKKSFWRKFPELCYHDELPREDIELWKRALRHKMQFKVLPDVLLYYRRHANQICK